MLPCQALLVIEEKIKTSEIVRISDDVSFCFKAQVGLASISLL